MREYILIFDIANIVSGAQIYYRNKIKYLEERGWKVIVLPTDTGKLFIKSFQKYTKKSYFFVHKMPYIFNKRQIKKFLENLCENIQEADDIIIETGTDYTSYWGELIAKKLNARHIVFFLDEKNDRVNRFTAPFFKFKYERNELASISEKSLNYIFSPFFNTKESTEHVLSAYCSNSISDEKNIDEELLPHGDYIIGSIGRLDKSFVNNIIEGIIKFADKYNKKEIVAYFIGGASNERENEIKNKLESKGIKCYVTGYIWPIPLELIKKIDIFVSGAGSSRISAKVGKTTIDMDVINNLPRGFFGNFQEQNLKKYYHIQIEKKDAELFDYFEKALIEEEVPQIREKIDFEEEWKEICKKFDEHMKFIENANENRKYYDTTTLWDGKVSHILDRIVLKFISYNLFEKIRKKYCEIFKKTF
ncbi:MAG: hypothetical protein MR485_00550 [Mollicutes bacterium]|nr:hypothetical protein [Mollicutes bacterium]